MLPQLSSMAAHFYMIDLMKQAKRPHHHLRLSTEFRSDLHWWAALLPKSMLRRPVPMHTITSDASGSCRCCAFGSNGSWFQLQSPSSWDRLIAAVRRALAEAGVDTTGYSGHSFRIGVATAAACAGLGDALIKTLGQVQFGCCLQGLNSS